MSSKMEQLIKDKRALESELNVLKQEKRELQKEKQESEQKAKYNYERLEDAMKKVGSLEKEIEL